MTARAAKSEFEYAALDAAEALAMLNNPVSAALPAPTQFTAVIDLIKSVFDVPAVAVALHGAPANSEGGVYRSFLEIPLIQDEAVIGSLRILDTAERAFSDRDCQLLEGFAKLVVDQVGLWSEASRDVLTGAMTRRAFTDTLRKTFAARARARSKASLVLFDLDHFKSVNDTWGHAAGDAVLKAVARAVQRELRVEDSFGRVGGEEFAILVANADAMTAADVADRVRRAVERLTFPGFEQVKITSSFGVAEANDSLLDVEDWTDRADAQLYAAKSSGRNRICIAANTAPRAQKLN
ncbi:MAG: sensor domain-containing diguanylate cyclase [Pararhodobacter sp.]